MKISPVSQLLQTLFAPPALALLLAANGCADAPAPSHDFATTTANGTANANATVTANATATANLGRFADLVTTLSEPDGEFFSDNLISNETSYLQIAAQVAARPAGGVYLGVGPEQNFTYIALTRPEVAFIVDIRRGNLLQHLHYKFLFDEARSRSHFLALLLGRPHDDNAAPGPEADLDAVIAHAERLPPDEKTFTATFDRACARIEQGYGVRLNANDRKTMELAARGFLDKQLSLRFELHETSGRRYPSLRELLLQGDPDGARRSFLAEEESFRFVQTMHREDRILPVVGDFAGDRAMPGIAALLKKHGLRVSTFYVSNVEQYLLEPATWRKWTRNIDALPTSNASMFIRAYLDQGRRHPKQMSGHRTATVLQRMADFSGRERKAPRSFFALATEGVLDDRETAPAEAEPRRSAAPAP
jgi:hypothetical protein